MNNFKYFAAITFILLYTSSCKKNEHQPPAVPPTPATLNTFAVRLLDTTTTTAGIAWTSAGDSTSNLVSYTIILDSSVVASKVHGFSDSLVNLKPNTTHIVCVRAYNTANDSVTANLTFTTKDTYFTFMKSLSTSGMSYDVAITPGHGYLIPYMRSGDTFSVQNQIPLHLLKTDSMGNVLWTREYTDLYDARNTQIKATTGGYLIRGWDYVIKVDSSGNILWSTVFDSLAIVTTSMIITSNNNIVLSASGSGARSTSTAAVMELNSNGLILWEKSFLNAPIGTTGNDVVESTSDNSLILLGSENNLFFVMKIDDQGNMVWKYDFGNGLASPAQMKMLNNQLLVGGFYVEQYYLSQMVTYRLDLNGQLLKTTLVGYPGGGTQLTSLDLTQDAGYIINADIGTNSLSYVTLFKYDSADNLQWEIPYVDFEQCFAIHQTSDGGYVFAPFDGNANIYLVKTNALGQPQ